LLSFQPLSSLYVAVFRGLAAQELAPRRRVEVELVARVVEHDHRPVREQPVEVRVVQLRGSLKEAIQSAEDHRLAGRRLAVDLLELGLHVGVGREAFPGGDPVSRLLRYHSAEDGMVVGLDEPGHQHSASEVLDLCVRRGGLAFLERANRGNRARPGVDCDRLAACSVGVHRDNG